VSWCALLACFGVSCRLEVCPGADEGRLGSRLRRWVNCQKVDLLGFLPDVNGELLARVWRPVLSGAPQQTGPIVQSRYTLSWSGPGRSRSQFMSKASVYVAAGSGAAAERMPVRLGRSRDAARNEVD